MKEESSKAVKNEDFFSNLKNVSVDYLEDRFELTRMVAIEKTSKLTSTIITYTITALLGFIILIFCGLLLGFYLNQFFKNLVTSFAIVTLIYVVLFIGTLIMQKHLKRVLLNNVIKILLADENR